MSCSDPPPQDGHHSARRSAPNIRHINRLLKVHHRPQNGSLSQTIHCLREVRRAGRTRKKLSQDCARIGAHPLKNTVGLAVMQCTGSWVVLKANSLFFLAVEVVDPDDTHDTPSYLRVCIPVNCTFSTLGTALRLISVPLLNAHMCSLDSSALDAFPVNRLSLNFTQPHERLHISDMNRYKRESFSLETTVPRTRRSSEVCRCRCRLGHAGYADSTGLFLSGKTCIVHFSSRAFSSLHQNIARWHT